MTASDHFETRTFPSSRLLTMDTCEIGRKRHYVEALIELDVTEARRRISEHKRRGEPVSFTAWLLHCIGAVCSDHPEIHALRNGRRSIAVFDDVDISILVERTLQGSKVPLPYVVRKVNEKSITEIGLEIRNAQNQSIEGEADFVLRAPGDAGQPAQSAQPAKPARSARSSGRKRSRQAALMRMYCALPAWLRQTGMSFFLRNPQTVKRNMGTVAVSSLGMMGRFNGWFVPIGIHPLIFAIGSVSKKPAVVGQQVEIREILNVTMLVDHDVVDGAPAARAMARLTQLVENCHGLE